MFSQGDNEVVLDLDQERPLNGIIGFLSDECGSLCGKDAICAIGNQESYAWAFYATDQSSGPYYSLGFMTKRLDSPESMVDKYGSPMPRVVQSPKRAGHESDL